MSAAFAPNQGVDARRIHSDGTHMTRQVAPAIARVPDAAEDFADWVSPHLRVMAHLASRLAPDRDQDDVVQEALVRAWRKRHQYDASRGSPRTWLLAITADQARRARRRARPDRAIGEFSLVDHSADERVDVEHAVACLPHRQQLAVNCYYFAGLTVTETAAVMRCSPGTVKSTLSDARDRLRQLLDG